MIIHFKEKNIYHHEGVILFGLNWELYQREGSHENEIIRSHKQENIGSESWFNAKNRKPTISDTVKDSEPQPSVFSLSLDPSTKLHFFFSGKIKSPVSFIFTHKQDWTTEWVSMSLKKLKKKKVSKWSSRKDEEKEKLKMGSSFRNYLMVRRRMGESSCTCGLKWATRRMLT